jgi:uncharacterized damage-inducible protein DinB
MIEGPASIARYNIVMTYYGPKEIAASFRTVRNNTIQIAEEIPEDQYGFKPSETSRTIAQTLAHIGQLHKFALILHRDNAGLKTLEGFDFMSFMGPIMAAEQNPGTKAQLIHNLRAGGEEFANWVATLNDDFLGEVVAMPAGGTPPQRTRFDMIISVKEHEMHHRGQLMVCQRMLGLVPHLTRAMQERMAAMQAAQTARK